MFEYYCLTVKGLSYLYKSVRTLVSYLIRKGSNYPQYLLANSWPSGINHVFLAESATWPSSLRKRSFSLA